VIILLGLSGKINNHREENRNTAARPPRVVRRFTTSHISEGVNRDRRHALDHQETAW
jgi:hypothetical protein